MKKSLLVFAASASLVFSQFAATLVLPSDSAHAAVQETKNMKKKDANYAPSSSTVVPATTTQHQNKTTNLFSDQKRPITSQVITKKPVHTLDSSKKYAQGEIIFKFKSGLTTSSIGTAGRDLGLQRLQTFKLTGAHLYKFDSTKKTMDEAIQTLKATGAFEYVEPNYVRTASAITDPITDPLYNNLWGLKNTGQPILGYAGLPGFDINVEPVWKQTLGDPNLVVGVIDTGTDINHPDLVDNIWTNPGEIAGDGLDNDNNGYIDDVHGWDFYYGDNTVYDYNFEDNHGTHVSGTIAANDNNIGVRGIAPNVKIMPLKFIGQNGGNDSDAILAIEYAKSKGVKILNNSWGGGGYSQALKDAIENSGALFIAAAGNDSMNIDDNYWTTYPAGYDSNNILTVGAVYNDGFMTYFSNYGVKNVDVFAPGADILSTVPMDPAYDTDYTNAYAYYDGTSMAAPHVTGIAALVSSLKPSLNPLGIKSAIMQGTVPYKTLQGLSVTGGLVNAANAIGVEPDNNIPGMPLTQPTVKDTLDDSTDLDDVYSIKLDAKEKVTLKLTGATGTDFDLYLYGPNAKTVNSSEGIYAFSEAVGTSSEKIEFTAPFSGTYYIDVYGYAGKGSYELNAIQGAVAGKYENTAPELNYTNTNVSDPSFCSYEPTMCNWNQIDNPIASDGNYAMMNQKDKTLKFIFNGTGIKYNAVKNSQQGIAKITIDGKDIYNIDLFSATETATTAFEKTGLAPGRHTFQIEWTGVASRLARKTATNINVDALEVIPEKPPEMFVENDNANVKYGEIWSKTTGTTYSGGSLSYISKTGANATFTFNGTGIKYVALKSPNYGLVDVYIDGQKVDTVNLYSATTAYKSIAFTQSNLPAGEHTIKIVSTGTKDPLAKAAYINVDSFIVENPNNIVKVEDNNAFLQYTGTWTSTSGSNYSGGTLKYVTTSNTNDTVEYAFNGTGISLYTLQSKLYGIADIFIDNTKISTVDLYNSTTKYKSKVFEVTNLTPGNHTIQIVRSGQKNALATANYLNIDYLEINY